MKRSGSNMKQLFLSVLVLVFIGCAGGNGDNGSNGNGDDPYVEPVTLTGIEIDWSTEVKRASGSDNFPITWCNDDTQITSYGDGYGFAESGAKKSLGFSRISGDYDSQTYQDLWSGNGKCYGIIEVGGALYAWVGEYGSGTDAWNESRLYLSTDKGVTWARNSWAFTKAHRIFALTFMQAGQGYADAPDDYVYIFAPYMQEEEWEVQKPGHIMLMRVPKDRIMDITAYEYFASSFWSSDINDMAPCLIDGKGVFQTSVIYFADLGIYVLATEHTDFGNGNLALYQANSPWGPWGCFYRDWGFDGDTFFWNFSAKWSSGENFAMIYTGIGSRDCYNSVKGRFIIQ